MPCLLELHIQIILDGLPDGVAVGADDHGAPHWAVVRELGRGDDVRVPGVEVRGPRRDLPLPVAPAGLRPRWRSRGSARGRGGGREPRRVEAAAAVAEQGRRPGRRRREQPRREAQQRRHRRG